MKRNTPSRRFLLAGMAQFLEPRRLLAAITSGETVNGVILTSFEVDEYTIDVEGGTPLLISVANTGAGGFAPRLVVLDPDEELAVNVTNPRGINRFLTDTESGTYKVRISDYEQNAGGQYALTVYTPDATQNDVDAGNVTDADSGRLYTNVISAGDLDVYQVDADEGDQLAITATESTSGSTLNLGVYVIDPDGEIVTRKTSAGGMRLEDEVEDGGTYTVVVYEATAGLGGNYGLSFLRVPGSQYAGDSDTATLLSGETRQGSVPNGGTDVWTIYLDKGVEFDASLDRGAASLFNPELRLYGPDGQEIDTDSDTNSADLEIDDIPESGTYYLVALDRGADSGGSYVMRYDLSYGTGVNPIVDGVLTLNGGDDDDVFKISMDDDRITVRFNGESLDYPADELTMVSLYGNDGNDSIDFTGTTVQVYVSGGSGDDSVIGGDGNDTLTGGSGKNRLNGGNGDDALNGSNGRDFLYGEGGEDRLYGSGGNDYLDGGGGVDRLHGDDGDDSLIGGSSNDRMYGDAGNDTLAGGNKGPDYQEGGDGDDFFQTRDGYIDTVVGGNGTDRSDTDNIDDDDINDLEEITVID